VSPSARDELVRPTRISTRAGDAGETALALALEDMSGVRHAHETRKEA
jgi:hypothetical protein